MLVCISLFLTYSSYFIRGSSITFSQIVNIMCPSYVAQYLELLDFFYEACLTALFSNRFVKFAAVLDNNGKLIIAEYRKGIQNYWRTDFISDNDHHRHDSSYLFHLDYLVPAIKKRGFCLPYSKKKEEEQQEEIHFEIIEIDDNVRLAIAPLNERKDKYLCIYVESSAPNREIISQLRNAII
ncbi:MAG: hypothetical protein WAJ93_12820 [Candidatus Nitrosopolaris sp.]